MADIMTPALGESVTEATVARWTKKAVGGVKIMATTFLNLVNGDWLRRPDIGSEPDSSRFER